MASYQSLCIVFIALILIFEYAFMACIPPHIVALNEQGQRRKLCGRRLLMRYYMVNNGVLHGRMRSFKNLKIFENLPIFSGLAAILSLHSTFDPKNPCSLTDHCCVVNCTDSFIAAIKEAQKNSVSPID